MKSPNILLEKCHRVEFDDAARTDRSVTHRAKIADFGLSKIFNKGKQKMQATFDEKGEYKKSNQSSELEVCNWQVSWNATMDGTGMMQANTKIGPSADIYYWG